VGGSSREVVVLLEMGGLLDFVTPSCVCVCSVSLILLGCGLACLGEEAGERAERVVVEGTATTTTATKNSLVTTLVI